MRTTNRWEDTDRGIQDQIERAALDRIGLRYNDTRSVYDITGTDYTADDCELAGHLVSRMRATTPNSFITATGGNSLDVFRKLTAQAIAVAEDLDLNELDLEHEADEDDGFLDDGEDEG